jgi:hypothetical protein
MRRHQQGYHGPSGTMGFLIGFFGTSQENRAATVGHARAGVLTNSAFAYIVRHSQILGHLEWDVNLAGRPS